MTQPNPFAQAVAPPAEQQAPATAPAPQQQQAPQANPYAQQQAMPAAAGAPNPFGAAVPQQQAAPAAAPPQTYMPNAQPQYGQPPAPTAQQQFYGAQPAQQAYAPPAPVQQAAPTGPPPALDPAMLRGAPAPIVGEGRGAKLAHMYGRLVLVFPLSITRKPRNPKYITPEQRQRGDLDQEQVTATFVVLDDGRGGMQPIMFGGDPSAFPPVADTESAPLPYVRKALWVTQTRMISQLRDFLPNAATGQPGGMVCGRVVKTGPQPNDPWYIATATDAEIHTAQQYMQAVASGHCPHPLA